MPWTDPDGNDWTAGQVVTAFLMDTYVKDNLSWFGHDRPRASAYGTLSVANGTTLDVPSGTWTGCSPNVGSMYSSGNSHLTFTTAGCYFVSCTAVFPSAGGKRGLALGSTVSGGNLSGSITAGTQFAQAYSEPVASEVTSLSVSGLAQVSGSTGLYIGCRQNSGAAMDVQFRLSAIWVAV